MRYITWSYKKRTQNFIANSGKPYHSMLWGYQCCWHFVGSLLSVFHAVTIFAAAKIVSRTLVWVFSQHFIRLDTREWRSTVHMLIFFRLGFSCFIWHVFPFSYLYFDPPTLAQTIEDIVSLILYVFHTTGNVQTVIYSNLLHWYIST